MIQFINEDIGNSAFGSSDLADKLHLSESQIYRKLKAITDRSTAVFIRSIRLQKAKELIETTDKTVSEIAYEVGFNDPSWFSRAFKEEFDFAFNGKKKQKTAKTALFRIPIFGAIYRNISTLGHWHLVVPAMIAPFILAYPMALVLPLPLFAMNMKYAPHLCG